MYFTLSACAGRWRQKEGSRSQREPFSAHKSVRRLSLLFLLPSHAPPKAVPHIKRWHDFNNYMQLQRSCAPCGGRPRFGGTRCPKRHLHRPSRDPPHGRRSSELLPPSSIPERLTIKPSEKLLYPHAKLAESLVALAEISNTPTKDVRAARLPTHWQQ